MSAWRAKVRALLSEAASDRVPAAPDAKTAETVKTPPGGRGETSFGGFGGFGLTTGDGDAEALAERTAIIEEGANVPRDWAEGFARLEAMPIPAGVDPAQWLAVLNAAGRFLDQWGSKAAALGWTAGELFGLDPDAPLNRRDRRGAAFFLAGAEVLAITAEAISLRVGGNVTRLYRHYGFGRPTAWERNGEHLAR